MISRFSVSGSRSARLAAVSRSISARSASALASSSGSGRKSRTAVPPPVSDSVRDLRLNGHMRPRVPAVRVTGERVSTPEGGFNPTWQRHVAAYAVAAQWLGPGTVLDLGCGVGHSYHLLAPRETVGVDIDAAALAGQDRRTVAADMRELPFAADSFASVVSVQSVEHVPDPERVVAEVARVLEPGGVAVFITPNRLTLGRPDEIIDPVPLRRVHGRGAGGAVRCALR